MASADLAVMASTDLNTFLTGIKLEKHAETMLQLGYDDVSDFQNMTNEDLDTMLAALQDAQVPPGHVSKILRAVKGARDVSELVVSLGDGMPVTSDPAAEGPPLVVPGGTTGMPGGTPGTGGMPELMPMMPEFSMPTGFDANKAEELMKSLPGDSMMQMMFGNMGMSAPPPPAQNTPSLPTFEPMSKDEEQEIAALPNQLLSASSKPARVTSLCSQIVRLARTGAAHKIAFVKAKTPSAMVAVLREQEDEPSAIEAVLGALASLAAGPQECKVGLMKANCLPAMVTAMTDEDDHAPIQAEGCMLMANLTAGISNKESNECRQAVAAKKPLAALLKAMKEHPSSAQVIKHGCATIANLSAGDEVCTKALKEANAPAALVNALTGHHQHVGIVIQHCCGALYNLLVQLPEADAKEIASPAVKAALEAICKTTGTASDEEAISRAKSALDKLTELMTV